MKTLSNFLNEKEKNMKNRFRVRAFWPKLFNIRTTTKRRFTKVGFNKFKYDKRNLFIIYVLYYICVFLLRAVGRKLQKRHSIYLRVTSRSRYSFVKKQLLDQSCNLTNTKIHWMLNTRNSVFVERFKYIFSLQWYHRIFQKY